jgi:hypothetical protein
VLVAIFPPEPQILEKSKRHHRHQHVMVQALPAPALKVIKPEFLLHLLMRLLAHPACFDGGGQALQRDILGVVGEVVLSLARDPALAHQPRFLSRQMLGARHHRAIGDPDPERSELSPEIALGAAPPRDAPPRCLR